MRVVKSINNNIAICVDNNNRELIAFGRGIGFPETPYILENLTQIRRTYYGINSEYLGLLNEISTEIFEISEQIVDYARERIKYEVSNNIIFTLADHINFAIKRQQKNIVIKMPFSHDIKHLYEIEMEIGIYAIDLIRKKLNISLSNNEAASIALHFINAQSSEINEKSEMDEDKIISDLTQIIEDKINIKVNKNGFNYARFVTHIEYLLKRKRVNQEISSENKRIFDTLKNEYDKTYECTLSFKNYLQKTLNYELGEEELLYLLLHINRLCSREDND